MRIIKQDQIYKCLSPIRRTSTQKSVRMITSYGGEYTSGGNWEFEQ